MKGWMRQKVLGIDPGWANFAYCQLGQNWRQPFVWNVERIMNPPYSEEALWKAIFAWCQKNEIMLKSSTHIVIERQMEAPFIVIATTIRTLYPKTTVVVSPKTVGKLFNLPVKRAEKKKAAVEIVRRNVSFPEGSQKKKDDLADAYLLALWKWESLDSDTLKLWKK